VKIQQAEAARRDGVERVKTGWLVLVVVCLLLGYVAMWAFLRPIWVIVLLHGVVGLVGLLALVSVGVTVRTPAANNLRSFALAKHEADASAESVATVMVDRSQSVAAPREEPEQAVKPAVRVREWFPETLLWRPELITDDAGRATLDVDLADSITTWRLTASAVTGDGRLCAGQIGLKVFQPFFVDLNLPVALTRGDEVAVPVVVYSYL